LIPYVVDTSVAVKWFLPETHSELALTLFKPKYRLKVPDLFWLEIADVFRSHAVRRILSRAEAESAWRLCVQADLLTKSTDPSVAERALELALETGTRVYDCLFLSMALGEECPLVTADRKFFNMIKKSPFQDQLVWVGDLQG